MSPQRWILLVGGLTGLVAVYVLQDFLNFYAVFFRGQWPPPPLHYGISYQDLEALPFAVNKIMRYLVNDLLSIAVIYAIFGQRSYVRFAMYVLLFGLVVLVPLYIYLYLQQPAGFSSMLSHLHRLVMNPVLMLLLIPAFLYQRRMQNAENQP